MITGFLQLQPPRLPPRGRLAGGTQLAIAGLLHVLIAAILILALPSSPGKPVAKASEPPRILEVVLPRIIFVPEGPPGGGGGGGGNRQSGPIRHAEGVGHDAATLRIVKKAEPADHVTGLETELPSVLLEARPLASGSTDQIGLPVGGVLYGTSTGPGSGGGVGTGTGTGIGSGTGPGIGPGSGGGIGGGVYRPGGAVTAPRPLTQVKPRYTEDALNEKIQGSVWLELVVTRDGRADQIRVVRSLNPGGLDEEAIKAVRQWRFEPGRLGKTPVDVMVTVVMDFSIR